MGIVFGRLLADAPLIYRQYLGDKMDSDRIVKVGTVIIITAALVILSFVAAPYIMGIFKPISEQTTVGYASETVRAEVLNIQEEGQMTISSHPA